PLEVAQSQLAISWALPYGIEEINGFNPLQPRRYTDFLFGPEVEDVSYGILRDAALLHPQNPLLSLLDVKYVLIPRDASVAPHPAWVRVFADDNVSIYRNPAPHRRAYYVQEVHVVSDPRIISDRVKAPGFQPRTAALVEGIEVAHARRLSEGGPAWVRVERVSPNELWIHTQTTTERFLVLSEMWFPGWRAEVDGRTLPIYRTNYLFRGLVVPPGTHTIRMIYRPASVLGGAIVTAGALAAILIALGTGARGTRRANSRGKVVSKLAVNGLRERIERISC
ncbi:MAG: YfhO family protein, partial [Ardenticatenaceae bacterium]